MKPFDTMSSTQQGLVLEGLLFVFAYIDETLSIQGVHDGDLYAALQAVKSVLTGEGE